MLGSVGRTSARKVFSFLLSVKPPPRSPASALLVIPSVLVRLFFGPGNLGFPLSTSFSSSPEFCLRHHHGWCPWKKRGKNIQMGFSGRWRFREKDHKSWFVLFLDWMQKGNIFYSHKKCSLLDTSERFFINKFRRPARSLEWILKGCRQTPPSFLFFSFFPFFHNCSLRST